MNAMTIRTRSRRSISERTMRPALRVALLMAAWGCTDRAKQATGPGMDSARLPDTPAILFSSNRTGTYEVYSMATDGSAVWRLTELGESSHGNHPAWAPDGRTVAFLKHVSLADHGVRQVLYTLGSTGDVTEVISGMFDPSWFRDGAGTSIAVTSTQRIWSVAQPDGSTRTLIHTGEVFGSPDTPDLSAQAWWDRENLLVFSASVGRVARRHRLFALDPSTGTLYEFPAAATAAGENRFPAVSSRGDIAFVSTRDGNNELYVLSDQGQLTRLTTHPASDHSPSWSADGSRLAFVSDCTGSDEIFVIGLDGSGLRNITNNAADDLEPAWSPR